MNKGSIYMYYGSGKGKTSLLVGQGLRGINQNKDVVIVSFLNNEIEKEYISLKSLEPNLRCFTFAKEKAEIAEMEQEINLAFSFSKKILTTGDCELLILDDVLDAIEEGSIDVDKFIEVLEDRSDNTDVILAGSKKVEKLFRFSDYVFCLEAEKFKEE